MGEEIEKPQPAHIIEATNKVQQLLDEVLEDGLVVLSGVVRWAEAWDLEDVPPEWVEAYGERRALMMFRAAVAAGRPSSTAPVGIKATQDAVSAILRFRKEEAPRDLPQVFIEVESGETLPTKRLKRE